MEQGVRTPSGVFISDDFRTNLIVDRHDPVLLAMRGAKTTAMRSENSEDVLTWNTFRSLARIDPAIWYPLLFARSFPQPHRAAQLIGVHLWRSLPPPPSLHLFQKDEGDSEVDVLIEAESFVWVIEAKYKSDVSVRTTNSPERDQVLRNVDVGSWHAGVRDFYFSLLVHEENSPLGVQFVKDYAKSREDMLKRLPHRVDGVQNVKGLGLLRWSDCASVLRDCLPLLRDEDGRESASRALRWLEGKGIETR